MEDLDGRGEKRLGPMIVAKAWTDPTFKAELLRNAGDAVEKLGIQSSNFAPKPKPAGLHARYRVLSPQEHAVMLWCTPCASCAVEVPTLTTPYDNTCLAFALNLQCFQHKPVRCLIPHSSTGCVSNFWFAVHVPSGTGVTAYAFAFQNPARVLTSQTAHTAASVVGRPNSGAGCQCHLSFQLHLDTSNVRCAALLTVAVLHELCVCLACRCRGRSTEASPKPKWHYLHSSGEHRQHSQLDSVHPLQLLPTSSTGHVPALVQEQNL